MPNLRFLFARLRRFSNRINFPPLELIIYEIIGSKLRRVWLTRAPYKRKLIYLYVLIYIRGAYIIKFVRGDSPIARADAETNGPAALHGISDRNSAIYLFIYLLRVTFMGNNFLFR